MELHFPGGESLMLLANPSDILIINSKAIPPIPNATKMREIITLG